MRKEWFFGGLLLVASQAPSCEVVVDGRIESIRCKDVGAVGPPACPSGSWCRAGICTEAELGYPCLVDSDCVPGDFCLSAQRFGFPGENRCSRGCCTSSDCGTPGFVCAIPTRGSGNVCIEGKLIGRTSAGLLPAFEICSADSDCRSGLCRDGRCGDTCCTDASCANGAGSCVFCTAPPIATEGFGFRCTTSAGEGGRYQICTVDADCVSGLCLDFAGQRRCSSPCCSSTECEVMDTAEMRVGCASVEHNGQMVRACSTLLPGSGTAPVGTVCARDLDCRSGSCRGGLCSDSCCTDASCGDPTAFVCRPSTSPNIDQPTLQCTQK